MKSGGEQFECIATVQNYCKHLHQVFAKVNDKLVNVPERRFIGNVGMSQFNYRAAVWNSILILQVIAIDVSISLRVGC